MRILCVSLVAPLLYVLRKGVSPPHARLERFLVHPVQIEIVMLDSPYETEVFDAALKMWKCVKNKDLVCTGGN